MRPDVPAFPLRRVVALGLLAALAVAWSIPGPVAAWVARQEPILLGRYTVGHFAGLAIATVVVVLVAALLWSRRSLGESALLAAMAALSSFAGVVAVASVAKQTIGPRYESRPVADAVADPALRDRLAGRVLTRQPSFRWDVLREDLPAPGRSYPNRVAGQPSRPVVLTTDARGLRNPVPSDAYDVVVTGDSFTEGSMVSDDEPWWSRLARETGLRIYNTAVSGLSVREYLNNWAAFGLDRGAHTVIVMLYEGNDWKPLAPVRSTTTSWWAPSAPQLPARLRLAKAEASAAGQRPLLLRAGVFDALLGDAPLRGRAERALIQLLAPIGASWPPPASPGLEWMPVAVEAGGTVQHYAFEPKHLMRLDWDPADFARAPEWTTNAAVLDEMLAIAQERGIRLVVAYAPSKPHVVLPLVRDRVTAEQLHDFAAFRDHDAELPPPDALRDRLLARLDAQQEVLGRWCAERGVEFLPLTDPLRAAMARGIPVYFTFDPHWTEQGHAAVARYVASRLVPDRADR